jgi:hypothetical protein
MLYVSPTGVCHTNGPCKAFGEILICRQAQEGAVDLRVGTDVLPELFEEPDYP